MYANISSFVQTRASYLRKDLNLSGDISTSRSRRGRTNNRSSSQAMIVAVEPDSDFSEHRRIDQGLIDASMEAASNNSVLQPPPSSDAGFVHQSNTKNWWGSFSTATATAAPPPPTPTASTLPTPTTSPQIPSNDTHNIKLGISHSAHVPKSSSSSSNSSSSMPKSNLQHRRTVSNKFRVP